jgi:hypothetical protein
MTSEATERHRQTLTSRLLRREALRRAAEEINTMSPAGLEQTLARISAEVTAEAADRVAIDRSGPAVQASAVPHTG